LTGEVEDKPSVTVGSKYVLNQLSIPYVYAHKSYLPLRFEPF